MKHFVLFITISILFSCVDKPSHLQSISGKQLHINSVLVADDSVEAFIKPYRQRINTVLDSVLAFAPEDIDKSDGELNSSQGNLMADIILKQASPIFKMRTGKEVDMALMNYGGIRNVISAGDITARTAFEVMPFENYIVVIEISGRVVREMVNYLMASNRPQPISGIKIVLNQEGRLHAVTIQGEPLDEEKTYYLATINYLLEGGGNAEFLKENSDVSDLNYLLRNAMIDYFKSVDTLHADVDDRFIQLKNL
ncbi:MAG: 5'-nucleotidase C-terminal domain-containing protein [Muriicola sp.]|nr:5'-nucleotidase C-terminal domain-containing protein [Muriicola sp.]NNC62276.1 5'-nucleotidase C-terminal domain-containing protein [Eudoraea sp.]NNK21680.1 5'-nucleotidase C-terminal domain-containing protein [Flavobacteriaceae bacterium]NNK36090.1 5'-nucleotidase C-terminal domain-containing protein [Eudoraea sp.]